VGRIEHVPGAGIGIGIDIAIAIERASVSKSNPPLIWISNSDVDCGPHSDPNRRFFGDGRQSSRQPRRDGTP
jgi:hypothetical protein